jgi:hypothetical protein
MIACCEPILSVESLDPRICQEKWSPMGNHCRIDLESEKAAVSIFIAPTQSEGQTGICSVS